MRQHTARHNARPRFGIYADAAGNVRPLTRRALRRLEVKRALAARALRRTLPYAPPHRRGVLVLGARVQTSWRMWAVDTVDAYQAVYQAAAQQDLRT